MLGDGHSEDAQLGQSSLSQGVGTGETCDWLQWMPDGLPLSEIYNTSLLVARVAGPPVTASPGWDFSAKNAASLKT